MCKVNPQAADEGEYEVMAGCIEACRYREFPLARFEAHLGDMAAASCTPTHELQRLGGWRTGAMVERYAHLAPEHLANAASRLNAVLSGYDTATGLGNEKRPASLKAA